MTLNIVLGFILPTLLSAYLFKKDVKLVMLIYPIAISFACIYNIFGFTLDYWMLKPDKMGCIAALPMDLGLYPFLSSLLIYLIHHKGFNSKLLILAFAIFTTVAEYVAVLFKHVTYHNGWNIGFTFFSYLTPYVFIHCYYKYFKKISFS